MATHHDEPPSSTLRLIQLPYELVNNIADLLSRQDFENFRLASKAIAECIKPRLALSHFKGVPWREDGKRLHSLSLISACARRIRSVTFNMGRLTEETIQWGTSQIDDDEELMRKWGPYFTTQDEFLGPVELPLDWVVPAIMRLPNLDTLCLTWTTCPWEDCWEIENAFNAEESVALAGDEVLKSQQAILDALLNRNIPLKTLTLEPIMHPELALPSTLDEKVSTVFGSVTQLHLTLKYEVDYFKPNRLDYFISFMPNIRDLSVYAWPVEEEAKDINFYITKRLQHLEKIKMTCIHVNLFNFALLMKDHGPTLKDVELQTLYGWCDPFKPAEIDWDTVFRSMKDYLKVLEKIRIHGKFQDNVGWHQCFFTEERPELNRFLSSFGDEAGGPLEKFILEGGEYPQPKWRI